MSFLKKFFKIYFSCPKNRFGLSCELDSEISQKPLEYLLTSNNASFLDLKNHKQMNESNASFDNLTSIIDLTSSQSNLSQSLKLIEHHIKNNSFSIYLIIFLFFMFAMTGIFMVSLFFQLLF